MQKPLGSRAINLSQGGLAVRVKNNSLLPRPVVSTFQNQKRTSSEKVSFLTKAKAV